MKQDELQKVLKNHILWLKGKGGEKADLSYTKLSGANLRGANLSGANLRYAKLSDAYLSDANLYGANLYGAKLSYTNLSGANLSGANLRYANLSGANLRYANLSDANLSDANLRYANLRYANLRGANLSGANLRYANLSDANLSDAYLSDANLSYTNLSGADIENVQYDESTAFFALQCPEEGSFVGWKKCQGDVLVKLLIPEDAKRSSATSRKCRASKVVVLEVIGANEGLSQRDTGFVYEVGKEVVADSFDDDRWHECSNGIHFFITRKEAQNY